MRWEPVVRCQGKCGGGKSDEKLVTRKIHLGAVELEFNGENNGNFDSMHDKKSALVCSKCFPEAFHPQESGI